MQPYDPTQLVQFWQPEGFDVHVPPGGFLSDFVLALRGIESPTSFCLWAGLWAVSSILKREVWFQWHPEKLFPNLYVVLVSPPKLCAKSTVARHAGRVLSLAPRHVQDPVLSILKQVNMVKSKASPESLTTILEPEDRRIEVGGKFLYVKRYSQMALRVSELTTFFGKQQYNLGMIDRLTDLYDCADSDDITLGRGVHTFDEVYVTLLGGTQPDKLQKCLPEEAFGGGFMSRVILVWEREGVRSYPQPQEVVGGPSTEELARRLAYIAEKNLGEFVFTESAQKMYEDWYDKFHKALQAEVLVKRQEMQYRYDIHLIKTALLIRAQQYDGDMKIGEEELHQAMKLLNATFKENDESIESVGVSDYFKHLNTVKRLIQKRKTMTRRQVMQSMSARACEAVDVHRILVQLAQSGMITVRLNGEDHDAVSHKGCELYSWVEK